MGAQYLNRFLRDIGSFNLGVPGQGNPLGNNIGADEKAAPAVANGALQAAQDALGIDYNSDGKGVGFNVPSLLGIHALPPYLHNGAAESLAAVVADVKHRTGNGRLPDLLTSAADQSNVVAFLESIDAATAPVFDVTNRATYSSPIAINATDRLIWVVNPSDDSVSVIRPDNNTRTGQDRRRRRAAKHRADAGQPIRLRGQRRRQFRLRHPDQRSRPGALSAPPSSPTTSPAPNRGTSSVRPTANASSSPTAGRTPSPSSTPRPAASSATCNLHPDPFSNHLLPRGLAVTADNSKLYVTRFLSFTKPGGRQGDDLGKEGLVTVLDINTSSTSISAYTVARSITARAPESPASNSPA